MNYKVQGSTEYILVIAAIIIVAIAGIVFLFTNISKSTHTQFNGQLLNATFYWSNSTVFNIGTFSTSQYLLFSVTSPLPEITNNSNNLIFFILPNGGQGDVNFVDSYNPHYVALISSQNGRYIYAANFSPYNWYNQLTVSSPLLPAPEGLNYIKLFYNNQNIIILPISSPIAMPVIQLTTSPALSLLPLSNNYVSPYGNITYTETGLPAGSTWTSTESQTYFHTLTNTTSVIVSANSINEVSLNPARDNFKYYQSFEYNILSPSVTYNGIIYCTFPDSVGLTYPYQTTYNFNYYQLKFGSFGYTLNKPLNSTIRGAIITLNNIPSNVIYSNSPFSNMLLTANKNYSTGGTPIYALITNYTTSSVTMDVWYDGPNTTTIYANFLLPNATNNETTGIYTGVVLPTNTTNWEQIGDTIFGGTSNFIALPQLSFNWDYNEPNLFPLTQAGTTYLAGMLGISTAAVFNIGFNDSIKINAFPLKAEYQTPYGGYYFSSSAGGYYDYILYVNNTSSVPNYLGKLVKTNYLNFQIAMSYSYNPNSIYLLINNEPLMQSTTTDSINNLSFAVDNGDSGIIVYAAQTTSNIYNYIATKIT